MNKSKLLFLIGIILLIIMTIHVNYLYFNHLQHLEYSAPAYVNIIYGVPYIISSISFFVLSFRTRKKK